MTDQALITPDNVLEVLQQALNVHNKNRTEIQTLYDIYVGKQAILAREKTVRSEINNRIVENHAMEIVDFKVGYLLAKPIQYVARTDDEKNTKMISKLNSYVIGENKDVRDVEIAEWNHICGTAHRMILPDRNSTRDSDDAPFEVYTLDPRNAFVVYLNVVGEPAVMAVKYVTKQNGDVVYTCYTELLAIEVTADSEGTYVSDVQDNTSLGIPIIEYPLNNFRMGAFEPVISLLNGINNIESNRIDGIEQFVQALLLFHNVNIDEEKYKALRDEGGIQFTDAQPGVAGEIKYLVEELDQNQTQTAKDDLYEQILVICGMPNRNGGSSTSDTGKAVIFRDGWGAADSRAETTARMFELSERQFLKKVLKICKDLKGIDLPDSSIKIQFTRRNYENIMEKSQVLTTMLANGKIAPLLAFTHCGMFADPEAAYKMSKTYAEEQERKALENAANGPGNNSGGESNPQRGQARGAGDQKGKNRRVGTEQ